MLGTVETFLVEPPRWLVQNQASWMMYGAHTEQASSLPKGTTLMCQNSDCHIGGFYREATIFTTQYHPEMTAQFIEALVGELEPTISEQVYTKAAISLTQESNRRLFATWVVAFFESA